MISDGPNKPLTKVCIGDKLVTFDEVTKQLVETTVVDIGSRQVNTWLKLVIEQRPYFVTKSHPFFTTRGLIPASQLVVGDMILHSDYRDKLSWSKRGDRNPMKDPDVARKSTKHRDWSVISQRMKDYHAKRKEDGIPVGFAAWHSESAVVLAKQNSLRMQREGNPNWGGGKHLNFAAAKREIAGKELPCDRCGNVKRLEIHHKDEDYDNDSFNNFERICHQCHSIEHKRGFNFWVGSRKDGKVNAKSPGARNGKEVQSIEKLNRNSIGHPLSVYNLTCSPHNSYLIDYMWVHNCDSMHAVDPIRIKESSRRLTVDQIVDEVCKLPLAPWVTLSGGDPVAWDDLGSVAANLKLLKYKVAVETQGALWNDWLHYADLVTCSPKGPSSGMVDKLDVAVLQKYKARLGSKLVFKVVAFDEVDLDFAERIHRAFSEVPLYITSGTPQQSKSRFATQMNTIDAYREISEAVLKRPALFDATVNCQQHVLLYGNELGR